MVRTAVRPARPATLVLDAYAVVLAVALTWPMLTSGGYPLARDLVVTPRQPLRPEALGLGAGAPRAAPLDVVVALLGRVVDGGLVVRVAIVASLVLSAMGAHRLVPTLWWPARALVAAFAVWNPYVVERLGLGQWALVLAYAACWWVVHGALAVRDGTRSLPAILPWLALAALTPTGALLGGGLLVALGVRRNEPRQFLAVVLAAVLAQLPWMVPALFGGGTSADGTGVAAFAARAERLGPALWSLLGLGGIWDAGSAPSSRGGVLGHLTSLVVLAGLAGAAVFAVQRRRRGVADTGPGWPPQMVCDPRMWVVASIGLLLASLTTVPSARTAVVALTPHLPGLGLVRDAQKWLVPFVLLAVVATGVTVDAVLRTFRTRARVLLDTAVVLAVVLPVALLPDATRTVWPVLAPVRYPTAYQQVARLVDGDDRALVTLPWRLYRRFSWGSDLSVYDPASRWFDLRVVTADALPVGDSVVRGDDPYAARLAPLVQADGPGMGAALARDGVRWVLVYRDDPDAVGLPLDGLTKVLDTPELALYRTAVYVVPVPSVPTWQVVSVALIDALTAVILLGAPALRVRLSRRRAPATVA